MKAARLLRLSTLSKQCLQLGLVCVALVVSFQAHALSSDRDLPIHITSDNADIDDAKGIAIYRGGVVMTQGTTRLTGNVITIYSKNREITRVVSEGSENLAYYEEEQDGNNGTLKAWGETIDYNMAHDTIELIRQARLEQKGDTFTGDRIDYNQLKQVVNAQSRKGDSQSNRVQMVIQPNQSKQP